MLQADWKVSPSLRPLQALLCSAPSVHDLCAVLCIQDAVEGPKVSFSACSPLAWTLFGGQTLRLRPVRSNLYLYERTCASAHRFQLSGNPPARRTRTFHSVAIQGG
jgi:hypothetical protein